MINEGMMSSGKHDWGTPPELFAKLDNMFHFTLDAAADQSNALCTDYLTENQDALSKVWKNETNGAIWLNPPYGRNLPTWMEKCAWEKLQGSKIVTLVPARPDTKWFRLIWDRADAVCFIYGRLRFTGMVGSTTAPFPSALAFFGIPLNHSEELALSQLGRVVK